MQKLEEMLLDIEQQIEVKAAVGDVYRSMLYRFGEGSTSQKGEPMQLILEQWPGGRWFRDRGNGIGHLWGHVQVIKPPVLLELSGPMFMSYPVMNHIELRLEEVAGGTKLTLRHRAIGFLDPAHREGVGPGWRHMLDSVAEDCTPKTASHRA